MQKPKLSIFVGESEISALKYISPDDYEFDFFPYSSPYYLYHNKAEEKVIKFIDTVIRKYFAKRLNLKLSDYDIYVGNINGKDIPIENARHTHVYEALSTIYNFSWMLVDNFGVYTPSDYMSVFPSTFMNRKSSDQNFFSNMSLFSYNVPISRKEIDLHESFLRGLVKDTTHKYDQKVPIIFSGSKFTHDYTSEENQASVYLSALSFLNDLGLYEIKIDLQNKLPTIAMLNYSFVGKNEASKSKKKSERVSMLTKDILDDAVFYDQFLDPGTALRAGGKVDCLFEKESGNPQLAEVPKDSIFIFPLEKDETARISVSGNNKIGKFESTVSGGSLGFILDTRFGDYETTDPEWIKVFKERNTSF